MPPRNVKHGGSYRQVQGENIMNTRNAFIAAAIVAAFATGASAAYLNDDIRSGADSIITALKADEGVPQNLVTAMRADEGVPQNLVTALKADEGVPQNLVTA
jgi:hypothetical protein